MDLAYIFFLFSNYAHAKVINVNECPVPFDFTVSDFCVLSTLGMACRTISHFLGLFAIGLIKANFRKYIFKTDKVRCL